MPPLCQQIRFLACYTRAQEHLGSQSSDTAITPYNLGILTLFQSFSVALARFRVPCERHGVTQKVFSLGRRRLGPSKPADIILTRVQKPSTLLIFAAVSVGFGDPCSSTAICTPWWLSVARARGSQQHLKSHCNLQRGGPIIEGSKRFEEWEPGRDSDRAEHWSFSTDTPALFLTSWSCLFIHVFAIICCFFVSSMKSPL